MAEGKILPVKTVLSHVKKCKSEECYSLNTESTVGPEEAISEALKCFFVEVLQRLEFSSAVTPQQAFAFHKQTHPAPSLLSVRPFHADE